MAARADVLTERSREGELYERYNGDWVRCLACAHRCPIPNGAPGVCKVRFNRGGRLLVPFGYVSGLQSDPIEKKPFFHAYPGSLALSLGMLGCNFHCAYCQNWVTSQALRDPEAMLESRPASAEAIVREALRCGARSVVSTYNEPLITVEWAVEIFRLARAAGLATGFVSNGEGTPEVIDYLAPWIDLFKVDLKGFDDRRYRRLGGRLQPVLDTIRALHERGIWVEVVTLLVPGFNDSDAELRDLCTFIAQVSPLVPWHVTAFHEDYRMHGNGRTTARMLVAAVEIGRTAGLKYVYAGNLPSIVGDLENTRCHDCGTLLIERHGYQVTSHRLTAEGTCGACGVSIPGRWSVGPASATGRAGNRT